MTATAVSCFTKPTIWLPSSGPSQNSLRSTPSSASCSTYPVLFAWARSLRLSVYLACSKRNWARRELRFSMASSNWERTLVAADQGSTTSREVQNDELLPKIGSPLTMTYLEDLTHKYIRVGDSDYDSKGWGLSDKRRYFVEVKEPRFTLYHEPHCVFENATLEQERADVIVTPVIKQILPGYTLVSGQEDAVKVAEWLKPKFIVTMKYGELNTKGILSKIVRTKGTTESFQELLA